MINLIPKEEKKRMIRGFYYKLLLMFFVMMNVIVAILFISVLPAYFFSSVKKDIVVAKLEKQNTEPITALAQQTNTTIKELNDKLNLIKNTDERKFVVSERAINAVVLKKPASIKITDIYYEAPTTTFKERKINIQGSATSRDALLSFRRSLEGDALFKKVDLPISNFVKGSNIVFFLTLIPTQ